MDEQVPNNGRIPQRLIVRINYIIRYLPLFRRGDNGVYANCLIALMMITLTFVLRIFYQPNNVLNGPELLLALLDQTSPLRGAQTLLSQGRVTGTLFSPSFSGFTHPVSPQQHCAAPSMHGNGDALCEH